MAEDEQGTPGIVPGLAAEFVAQLRAITGGLEGLAGTPAWLPPVPGAFRCRWCQPRS